MPESTKPSILQVVKYEYLTSTKKNPKSTKRFSCKEREKKSSANFCDDFSAVICAEYFLN